MPDIAVILPAAGRSTRFGGPVSKIFAELSGEPVLAWTLRAFAKREEVVQIVVAASDHASVADCVRRLDGEEREKVKIVSGGASRAESVRAGAQAVVREIEWVAVHDAARPLVSDDLIGRVIQGAIEHGAAAAALAMHLTIKQARGPLPARVERTIPRGELWALQTPQVMRRADLLEAIARCPIPLDQVTDDLQLLELIGKPTWLVEGEERNLKITTRMDLEIAEAMFASDERR